MAPMMFEEQQQAIQQQTLAVPIQKGINLTLLVDHLLQKTYHDLSVLSEL